MDIFFNTGFIEYWQWEIPELSHLSYCFSYSGIDSFPVKCANVMNEDQGRKQSNEVSPIAKMQILQLFLGADK